MRLQEGQLAPLFTVKDIFENQIALNNFAGQNLMISFYRFSSCPFCNLRVRELMRYAPEFQEKGLHMLSFWQSPKESILEHIAQQHPPFPFIPDPAKVVYRRYGVEQSWTATAQAMLLHPLTIYKAVRAGFRASSVDGDKNLVPADFLIGPDQTIQRAYYGKHVGDHLPIAEIEQFLATSHRYAAYPTGLGGVL